MSLENWVKKKKIQAPVIEIDLYNSHIYPQDAQWKYVMNSIELITVKQLSYKIFSFLTSKIGTLEWENMIYVSASQILIYVYIQK